VRARVYTNIHQLRHTHVPEYTTYNIHNIHKLIQGKLRQGALRRSAATLTADLMGPYPEIVSMRRFGSVCWQTCIPRAAGAAGKCTQAPYVLTFAGKLVFVVLPAPLAKAVRKRLTY
jgi:hypothetical protein